MANWEWKYTVEKQLPNRVYVKFLYRYVTFLTQDALHRHDWWTTAAKLNWDLCFLHRYQYYLQLKKDVLEGRIACSLEQAMRLASLAVQGTPTSVTKETTSRKALPFIGFGREAAAGRAVIHAHFTTGCSGTETSGNSCSNTVTMLEPPHFRCLVICNSTTVSQYRFSQVRLRFHTLVTYFLRRTSYLSVCCSHSETSL